MNELVHEQLVRDHTHQSDFFDDFVVYSTNRWTFTDVAAGPNATATLNVSGVTAVTLDTSNTDNAEGLLASNTAWDITSGRPTTWESRATSPEANTDDANYFFGHSSTKTTTMLQNNGAGLVASFSGFGFYKVDGGTYWKFASSVAATRYGDNTTKSLALNTGYSSFRVEVRPISSTECEIVPLIDLNGGNNYAQCKDYTTGLLIKHILTYTSYAPAYCMMCIKSGGANSETNNVDWVRTSQRR